MTKLNLLHVLTFYLFTSVLASCGSDDDSSTNSNMGSFELTVTGDFEATKSGFADFDSLDAFSLQSWSIDMSDAKENQQSMSLSLSASSAVQDVSRPTPGTYQINFSATDASIYNAIYAHIPNNNFLETEEYSTLPLSDGNYSGTLTITKSTEENVSGSFEFTAAKTDDDFNISGEITVKGEFNAYKRRFD